MHNCKISTLLFAGVLLGVLGCRKSNGPSDLKTIYVHAVRIEQNDITPSLVQTGLLKAKVQSELAFKVSGRLIARQADVGNHVVRNQELASLDAFEQKATLTAAEAALRAAEARLGDAAENLRRQKFLYERGNASQATLDSIQTAFLAAQAMRDAAKAQFAISTDILEQTVLRAEESGVIVSRLAEAGQVVLAAQSVYTLAHDGPREAIFQVHESALTQLRIQPGTEMKVFLIDDPSVSAIGEISEISPSVSAQTGTITVKISILETPVSMTLGSTVGTAFKSNYNNGIQIPSKALHMHQGRATVWVIGPDFKALQRDISIGRYGTDTIVVSDGLKVGELIVTDGANLVTADCSVKVIENLSK